MLLALLSVRIVIKCCPGYLNRHKIHVNDNEQVPTRLDWRVSLPLAQCDDDINMELPEVKLKEFHKPGQNG